MDNEKIKVLKMLEEGKINAEEASRLLDSLKRHDYNNTSTAYNKKPSDFDSFTTDLGKKISDLSKDLEPKINKFASVVLEKTATVADKISESFSKGFDDFSKNVQNDKTKPRVLEAKVYDNSSELNLSNVNGDIVVKGYNGDKITITAYCKSTPFDAHMEIISNGKNYSLYYDEREFQNINIDMLIPHNMFTFIKLSTQSGKILISDIVSNVVSVDNFNAPIALKNCDIENLKIITSNAEIFCENYSFSEFNQYEWFLETNNFPIKLNIPKDPIFAYYINACTTLGSISMSIPNLNYLANDKYNICAKSINYENITKKIKLSLETSNSEITV